MYNLSKNQLIAWQTAYKMQNEETPRFLFLNNGKNQKEFVKPFLDAKYIEPDHFKYAGIFRLTNKGKQKFEELKSAL